MFDKRILVIVLALGMPIVSFAADSADEVDTRDFRHFLFIGEPSAEGWKTLMNDPVDRKPMIEAAFESVGGKLISYYWGLGNGKNYVTVAIPNDNELLQALYLTRMPTGILASYQVIELMPSDQMPAALAKTKELLERDTTLTPDE